ncbi:MAG TPA: DNA translocase FtsK 4TM domain-containing protein [Ilumatobacteraceae bacterium]|nr:DNA translocase FtsK 4TM domain-containing protein [Ilumatobacteraceae bacterium]
MTTWGPSKKTPQKRTASGTGATSRTTRTTAANRGSVRDATPPSTTRTRRTRAQEDLRGAVEGREHEFVGVGLIGGGVLLGLAIYWNLAGPLGRGIEKLFGWITGIGRFVVPVVLISVGIALVHKGRSSSPFRLVLGWGLMALSTLGFLHVVRGPDKISAGFDELGRAGGWLGALVAEPLRALLASAGAVVVMLAAFVGGLLLVTSTSLRTMAMQTSRGVGSVARPLGRAARKAIADLSTLSSDKADRAAGRDARNVAGEASALAPPNLYDLASEDGNPWSAPSTAAKPRKRRGRSTSPAADGQPQLPLEGVQVGEWTLPPLSYLNRPTEQAVNRAEIERRGQTLQEALEQHGVDTVLLGMTVGPTVTRYELELGPGVKVARVTTLQKDIAYAMAATDVRILAPIPGRSAIGVEVPNHQRQLVALGDLLAAPEAKTATDPLDVAIGKDIAGRAVFLDLATTPHLLIAGATGAGKSSGLNCIITSLLMRSTPDQVRLILIDPKQVEMGQYQRLPHLLTQPVTNPKKAANALAWAVKEMDRRYDILSEVGFRDITGYNAAFDRGEVESEPHRDSEYERLPFIVVVVDELNDLMMVAARDVEDSITRIAQKARAVGIHLIVATQRPSVNVITGVIKANIPARAAFAVSSLTDSRVILDQSGAEKLCGQGDMLLLPGNSSVAQRIQGAFVSEQEVRKVVAHWRRQAPDVSYVNDVEGGAGPHGDDMVTSSDNAFSSGQDDDDTVMLRQAMELVVRSQLGSTSMLQRKLKVGFARAGRIMDLLEQRGVVGPSEGSKAREVLMTVEEFELLRDAGER